MVESLSSAEPVADVVDPEDLGEEPELPPHAAAPANTIAIAAVAATCRLCVCTGQECHKFLSFHALMWEPFVQRSPIASRRGPLWVGPCSSSDTAW
ncbi:hypothetical protein GCM10010390_87730 [Streptomyces mordarskii]|uniref:Uncharacterized protein n=1 Tax=Streptomyces mordarskii TaxID=1226758 RepID=A0ABN1EP89_9ACTN